MIRFPDNFVKTKYSGYFWNTEEQQLYSIKVGGILKPLKYRKRVYTNNYRLLPEGYDISHKGKSRRIPIEELIELTYSDNIEFVDIGAIS